MFTSKWFNTATIVVDTISQLEQIRKYPFVKSTEKVYRKRIMRAYSGFDKFDFNHSSELQGNYPEESDYGKSYRQIQIHQGQWLHQRGFRGKGVMIAVIDAGFIKVDSLEAFESLRNEQRILMTRDFVDNDTDVFHAHSHGTIVLSVITGKIEGKLLGTAPEASFLLLRSENASSEYLVEEDAWIAAAELADSMGADIISSSLGYSLFDNPAMNHSVEEMDGKTARVSLGAQMAASRGILVVNSAGNSGLTDWGIITAPADADSILAVGAVDMEGKYVSFSSRGPSADGRIKPDVMAVGAGTVVTSLNTEGGFVDYAYGTSLACPVITGLAACLIQAFPNKSIHEIRESIIRASSLYGFPNDSMGYGIPDFSLSFQMLSDSSWKDLKPEILKVFPNPVEGNNTRIIYSSPQLKPVEIKLMDMTGKILWQKEIINPLFNINHLSLDLGPFLKPGFYLLLIENSQGLDSVKLIKL